MARARKILTKEEKEKNAYRSFSRPKGTDTSRNVELTNLSPEEKERISMDNALEGLARQQAAQNIEKRKIEERLVNEQLEKQQPATTSSGTSSQVAVTRGITPAPGQNPTPTPLSAQDASGLPSTQEPQSLQEQAEQANVEALDRFFNFLIDPLAPIAARGQEAVNASPQGSGIQKFNEKLLIFTENLRADVKQVTRMITRQVGRSTGAKGVLKDNYTNAVRIKNTNIQAMNAIVQAANAGLPLPNGDALFQQYKSNIYEEYSAVNRLASSNVNNYIENGIDTLEEFETAVDVDIPSLEAQYQYAKARRAAGL